MNDSYAHQEQTRPLSIRLLLSLLIGALLALLLFYAYLSLQWPMMRDSAYLHYMAYLINEHNFVPYRDVFETSWFGSFLFHMSIGKLFGYSSTDFHYADITFLAVLLTVTWHILRHFDKWLAWVGTLSIGLTYLHFGAANTLQRDYILLLPIACTQLTALQKNWHTNTRAFLIGIGFGIAASIKPHAIIGLPVVLGLLYSQTHNNKPLLPILLYTSLGVISVFFACFLWLWWRDGLTSFVDITLNYLPLYQALDGAHKTTTSTERWNNTLHWWKYFLWIWPYSVGIGAICAWHNANNPSVQRPLLLSIVGLTICYNIYPLIAGKFWDYHWIPYAYFGAMGTSLLLSKNPGNSWKNSLISICLLLYFLYVMKSQYLPWNGYIDQIKRFPDIGIDQDYDKKVSRFIDTNLKPGEKIQVIDETGPTSVYLLQAQAVLATPYLEPFVFLHHINSPYVQQAQIDFLQRLQKDPPALFLIMKNFVRPTGAETVRDIPNLDDFIQKHYSILWQQPQFTIWQYQIKPAESDATQPTTVHSAVPSPP